MSYSLMDIYIAANVPWVPGPFPEVKRQGEALNYPPRSSAEVVFG